MDRPIFILGVDDEPNILDGLKRQLRSKKYKLFTALNAAEGLEILETHYIDVVISDQKMPGMSGNDFLKIVREKYPDVIRIMVSGHCDFNELISAINEGEIFRFLAKPYSGSELENIIHMSLEQKQLLGVLSDKLGRLSQEAGNEISSVESFAEQGYIYVKIKNLVPKENIAKILTLIQGAITETPGPEIKLSSSILAQEQDALLVTMHVGKNLAVKVEFANPLEIPAWAARGGNGHGHSAHLHKGSSHKTHH